MRTLTAHSEIDRLFAGGRRVSNPALLVLGAPTSGEPGSTGRVMFVAGKRLGGAVLRNRCKRVMREAVRRSAGPYAGWDIAVIARPATPQASPDVLDEALERALNVLGVRR